VRNGVTYTIAPSPDHTSVVQPEHACSVCRKVFQTATVALPKQASE